MTTISQTPMIALAGNPNVGKTTLFNRLTGLRRRVGNYPGVTVERKSGTLKLGDRDAELVDLPGTYSLAAASPDELVVADALNGLLEDQRKPDLVLFVADAGNFQRNLFLASQIADLGLPLVIAVNMVDSAERKGIRLDAQMLSERLDVPVVEIIAKTGKGLDELLSVVSRSLHEPSTMTVPSWPKAVDQATERLTNEIHRHCGLKVEAAVARRLLFDAKPLAAARLGWDHSVYTAALSSSRELIQDAGTHPLAIESLLTYRHLSERVNGAVIQVETTRKRLGEQLDNLLLHRFFGLAIFVGLMYVMFQAIYAWAGPLMDLIDGATGLVQHWVSPMLTATPMLHDLVVDAIIGGVGGVIIFLPQICILYLFVSVLEDSGYMARTAFLMDRLFGWCGLNGKSFIPMLSAFACAIPGVMAARTIESPKARLTTILTAPLMSCSARLPVYVLLIGTFIEPLYGPAWAGFALFALHFIGLAVAIPVAWGLNRFILKTPSQPFVLEMPEYRMPVFKDVFLRVAEKGKAFVLRAGTIILAMSVIIWFMLYFPRPEALKEKVRGDFANEVAVAQSLTVSEVDLLLNSGEGELAEQLQEDLENRITGAFINQSLLAKTGRAIQPIFAPAGYDWKITVGVIASFPAREVIIATLGMLYNLGDKVDEEAEDLRTTLLAETWTEGSLAGEPIFTMPVVLSILVFFALCMQCGATVATIWKETTWKWALFSFAYMTTLAWVGAVATFQIGRMVLG